MTHDPKDDEPTAAAVLANPDLDPELARRLRDWFGEAQAPAAAPTPAPSSPLAALLREVDPAFLDRLFAERLEPDHRLARPSQAVSLAQRDTATMRARVRVPELRPLRQPMEFDELGKQATPQAILRDLHRPVWYFDAKERVSLTTERGGIDHRRAVAEAMQRRPAARVPRATAALSEARAELRALLTPQSGEGEPS